MFQISSVKTRYFEFENPDNGQVLHLEPPKLKTLNKLSNLAKAEAPGVDEMAEVMAKLISKNREDRKVTADTVMEWMTSDDMTAFFGDFLHWLNKTKEEDPN